MIPYVWFHAVMCFGMCKMHTHNTPKYRVFRVYQNNTRQKGEWVDKDTAEKILRTGCFYSVRIQRLERRRNLGILGSQAVKQPPTCER